MSKPSAERRLDDTEASAFLRASAHQRAQAEPRGPDDPRQGRRRGRSPS